MQRVGEGGWSRDVWTGSKVIDANNREWLNRGILISPSSTFIRSSSIGERLNIALFLASTGCTRKTGGGREGSNSIVEGQKLTKKDHKSIKKSSPSGCLHLINTMHLRVTAHDGS